MKYGIDIFDEWHNVPDDLKEIAVFDDLEEAKKWGIDHTNKNDPIYHGFYIYKTISDKIIYHHVDSRILEKDDPIESRFELLDFREEE